MRGFARLKSFVLSDSGAVTVDWVVLTAALVGLGLAVTNTVSDGLQSLSNEIRTQLERDHTTAGFN